MDPESKLTLTREHAVGEVKKGFGLINVHERIQLYYGRNYGMKVYSRQGFGTRILIKIPRCNWREKNYAEAADR